MPIAIRPKLPLNPDERWGIVGKTGSGKSVFGKWLMARWRAAGWRILIIDQYLRWANTYAETPQEATLHQPYILHTPHLIADCPVMIYKPTLPAYADHNLDLLLFEVVETGYVVVLFDEGRGVSTSHSIPPGVSQVMVAGRKAHVPVYFLTQAPRVIHPDILAMCEWLVLFQVNRPEDREYMAVYMEDPQVERAIKPFWFWVKRDTDERARLFHPLPESEIKQWLPGAKVTTGGRNS